FVGEGPRRTRATAGHRGLLYLRDVPTADEIGLPRWEVETWYGLFAPRGTPKPIVDELNGHIQAMFNDPGYRQKYAESFYEPMPMSSDAFAARVKADVAKWERIVQETGVEPQ